MDVKKKKQVQLSDSFINSPPNSEPIQKTPTRAQGRIAKRKLHNDGENDEIPFDMKKKRRSSSTSCMTSPTNLLKPALTERQQLALLLQMTDPQKQQSQSPITDGSPRDTPTGKSKIHRRNERGETPLHLACIKGDITTVNNLIDQGANIDAIDNAGWTPLHEACNHGHVNIVAILIDKGVNVNVEGMGGDTPLHDAVINNHKEVVKLLLSKGANPNIKNTHKQSPLDICREDSISILLKKALSQTQSDKCDVFTDNTTTPKRLRPSFLHTHTPPPSHCNNVLTKLVRRAETPPPRFNSHSRFNMSRFRSRRIQANSRGSFHSDHSSSESDMDDVIDKQHLVNNINTIIINEQIMKIEENNETTLENVSQNNDLKEKEIVKELNEERHQLANGVNEDNMENSQVTLVTIEPVVATKSIEDSNRLIVRLSLDLLDKYQHTESANEQIINNNDKQNIPNEVTHHDDDPIPLNSTASPEPTTSIAVISPVSPNIVTPITPIAVISPVSPNIVTPITPIAVISPVSPNIVTPFVPITPRTSLEPITPKDVISLEPITLKDVTSLEPITPKDVTSLEPITPKDITSLEPITPKDVTSLELITPKDVTSLEPIIPKAVTSIEPIAPKTISSLEPITPYEPINPKAVTSLEPIPSKAGISPVPISPKTITSLEPITTLEPITPKAITPLVPITPMTVTSLEPITPKAVISPLPITPMVPSVEPITSKAVTSIEPITQKAIISPVPIPPKPISSPVLITPKAITLSVPITPEVTSLEPITPKAVISPLSLNPPLRMSPKCSSPNPSSPTVTCLSPTVTTCMSPTVTTCRLSVMSGKARRVSSINDNNDQSDISDNNDDSSSTVVSFSTSLPIVFGSLPCSNICSSVSRSCSPKRTRSLSPFMTLSNNNNSVITPTIIAAAVTEPNPVTQTQVMSHDEDNPLLLLPLQKKPKKSTTVIQQEEKDCIINDGGTVADNNIQYLHPKLTKQVYRSHVINSRKNNNITNIRIPHNYESFLTTTHSYRSNNIPLPTLPQEVYPPLLSSQYKLFTEQEHARILLLTSHVNEVDRLVVCFEQELLRAHQRANTPYHTNSVCSVLTERMNPIYNIIITNSNNNDSDHLLNSYIRDVWDKYHRCSELLANRHKLEIESLWLLQRQQWLERHSQDQSSFIVSHVPITHTGTFPNYIR